MVFSGRGRSSRRPARLEQRIARVHRMGQSRPVQVIHFLTKGSIEERVWETLRLKKALFSGVFDSPTAEVNFEALGRKNVLQVLKEAFANQPGRLKPIISPPPQQPVNVSILAKSSSSARPQAEPLAADSAPRALDVPPANGLVSVRSAGPVPSASTTDASVEPATLDTSRQCAILSAPKAAEKKVTDGNGSALQHTVNVSKAAADFLAAGLQLLEVISALAAAHSVQAPTENFLTRIASDLMERDSRTDKAVFKVPAPNPATIRRLGQAATAVLDILTKPPTATT
jgi:hypothetical protein